MPKIVEHDVRRRELARAALRVIGRDGLDAATTRNVAAESGWSTGVLKHYFESKDELLRFALRELERRAQEAFAVAEHSASGVDAVRTAIAGVLASDREHTRVWIAYLSRASTDPAIAGLWKHAARQWVQRWATVVRRGQADGSIRGDADADAVGRELHALVGGLRINAFFGIGGEACAVVLVDQHLEP